MKIASFLILAAACAMFTTTPTLAQDMTVSRAECAEMGEVIGDPGDGSVAGNPDYICENGQPPLAMIMPAPDEPISSEGEVCCGMEVGAAGPDSEPINLRPDTDPADWQDQEYTRNECTAASGTVVGDIGNGAIFQDDYTCDNTLPPMGVIVPADGEPIAIEGEVCCGPPIMTVYSHNNAANMTMLTEDECLQAGGEIVGDIGDGAIYEADYMCNSNDQPPLGAIGMMAGGGGDESVTNTARASVPTTTSMAVEGSVCCGGTDMDMDMDNNNNMGTTEVSATSRIGLMGALAVSVFAFFTL